MIITQCSVHNPLFKALRHNECDQEHPFKVKTLKRSIFRFDEAKKQISKIQITADNDWNDRCSDNQNHNGRESNNNSNNFHPSTPSLSKFQFNSPSNQLLPMYSIVNMDDSEVISALGGLLTFIIQHRVLDQLDEHIVYIKALQTIPVLHDLRHRMYIDQQSLSALSVFATYKNPSSKGCSTTKEGYSLFKIIDINTNTTAGSRKLREWMTFPLSNCDDIWYRLDHIEWFLDNKENGIFEEIVGQLASIRDLRQLTLRITSFRAKYTDLCGLYQSLMAIHALCMMTEQYEERTMQSTSRSVSAQSTVQSASSHSSCDMKEVPVFQQLQDEWTEEIQNLVQILQEQIDFNQTKSAKTVKFNRGMNEKLDHYTSTLDRLPGEMRKLTLNHRAQGMIPNNPDIEYICKPFMGFFLRVPSSSQYADQLINNAIVDHFEMGRYKHFRTDLCIEANNHFGDIWSCINMVENDLLVEIEKVVAKCTDHLEALNDRMAELDCLCALGATAYDQQWCKPELLDSAQPDQANVFYAENAYHPIQQNVLDDDRAFIPNDIHFDDISANENTDKGEKGRILVLSGPNQSGKSVYLKQCGIVCYLAHIGSYVPATKCRLSVVDKILTRIHSTDDVHSSLSTYSRDCCQMAYLLRNCTEHSLCLIDEFGKGTWTQDGIALMTSIIRNFDRSAANGQSRGPPKVLIATHFHELFQQNLIRETKYIRFYFMEIVTAEMAMVYGHGNDRNDRILIDDSHSNSNAMDVDGAEQDDDDAKASEQRVDDRDQHRVVHRGRGNGQYLTFLYKVKPGICDDSFGLECARSAGISELVRQRTKLVMDCVRNKSAIEPIESPNQQKVINTAKALWEMIKDGDDWKEGNKFSQLVEMIKNW